MSMSQEISGRELERCPLLETSRELYTRDRDTIYPEEAYDLSDADFVAIRDILHRIAGIYLTDSKRDLVRLRLARRLRDLGGIDFGQYLEIVRSPDGARELSQMVDLLTTNKTNFFREPIHFDFLRDHLLPELLSEGRPIRVWSAGCSTGEEAYSLAITILDAVGRRKGHDIRILGTDISARVIEVARAGVYDADAIDLVPDQIRNQYFRPVVQGDGEEGWEVIPEVRSLVRFARLNLMAPWPMRGHFDIIFCRNVMLYFDLATRQRLVERLEAQLRPGGYLFIGHSESLGAFEHGLRYIQPAVYRK